MTRIRNCLAAAMLCLAATAAAADGPIVSYDAGAAYADVAQDVKDAIINRGLVIDYTAHVGDMLNRTAADVGATGQIYTKAEVSLFCSAILSRKMMEAGADNLAYCPYGVFAYELAGEPGKVKVGYRRVGEADAQSGEVFGPVNALLDEIAREASGQ